MMHAVKFSLLCAAVLVVFAGETQASIQQYTMTVTVTSAPVSPGSFLVNPWSFGTLPGTFVGTFDADNTNVGPISNLSLVIGGLNIATSHPSFAANSFNPNTLELVWAHVDPSNRLSAVVFGSFRGRSPSNYAVAVQNSLFPPLDPFLGNTQNWVGTYSIYPSNTVPEPASLAIWGLGAFGAAVVARRRKVIA